MTSRLPVLALCLLLPGWLRAQADPQDCPRLRASGASADLYCMPLVPAPGISAHGSVELGWVPGPFTVAVSPAGVQRWNLLISTSGLVSASTPPGKAGLVVWAAPPSLTPLVKLGVLRTSDMQAGPVAFDRFLLLISAESDTATSEIRGRVVLRGESPGNRLRPADTYQFFLGALGPRTGGGDPMSHHPHGDDAWGMAPMYPGLDMLPSEMAGRPVQDERSLELMTPAVRAAYVRNRAYIDTMPGYMFTKDGFARALAFDKAFYAAGGVLASGVDPTGNGGALPGFGDQRGYELLRESGLTAEQAVQVVSYNGARVLGVEGRLGSVEKGKIADLVLLRGDLVADPSVIRNVVTVYKDGVAYDPAKLIDAVRGRVGVD